MCEEFPSLYKISWGWQDREGFFIVKKTPVGHRDPGGD